MGIIFHLLATIVSLYVYVLLARVVIDLIQVFSRDWRPTGFVLVLCEVVYTLTDPPVKLMRRIIPPIRLGQISLDLGFIVVFILVQVLAGALRVAGNSFA
ncbi:YggT family protein [Nocardia zapadnayensis]|uniref:YggT family protein n=1 Tax=Brevibacterium sp. R8603A2 TaxID=2929779 RepID=UPI001FF8C3EF|nr:YggT family protein [Nocardia zapadnayensis]MCK1804144.1 YggT family protein [Brevibacterium sp. R8603A2]MCX0276624.1 YggT family protein [Nocardia zapadnayensis]